MITFSILVLVGVQGDAPAFLASMSSAAERALGPGAEISVRTIADGTPDEEVIEAGRAARAGAVVRVRWVDGELLRARLEVTVLASSRHAVETLAFSPVDPLAERGRAIGLVIASLLRPDVEPQVERTAAADERPAAAPISPAAAAAAVPAAPTIAPASHHRALDAAVEGGVAVGEQGSSWGGAFGYRWRPWPRLGGRIGMRARFGEVTEAQSSSLSAAIAAGLIGALVTSGDDRRFGLALRADALLLYESLSHLSDDDPTSVRRGRWLPGAALLAEASWAFGSNVAITFGSGAELAFGRTDVYVRQLKVAELAPLRFLLQGGLLVWF